MRATGRERKDAESRSKGWKLEDESEESFEENLTQMREELVERSVSIRIKQLSNLVPDLCNKILNLGKERGKNLVARLTVFWSFGVINLC